MQEQEIKDETTSVETTETTISTETADKDKKVRNRIHRKPAPAKEAKATTAPADTKNWWLIARADRFRKSRWNNCSCLWKRYSVPGTMSGRLYIVI